MDNSKDFKENEYKVLNQLITELYLGKGIQAIADLGSKMLDNPVIILDTSFRILAVTEGFTPSDTSMLLNKNIGYLDEQTINTLKNSLYLRKLSTSNVPLMNDPSSNLFHNVTTGYGWIDGAIRLHGIVVGFFNVYGVNRAFRQHDMEIVEKLMQLSSMEFQKDTLFLQNHGIQFESLLVDCLEGRISDDITFSNRLHSVGRAMQSPYCIIVTSHFALHKTQTGFAPGLQARLRQFFPGSITAAYEGNIVLLHSLEKAVAVLSEPDEDFLLFLEQNNLHIGVSNSFTTPESVREFYQQALFCSAQKDKNWIHFYEDFTIEHVFSKISNEVYLYQLCLPALMRLAESKKASDKELLETLYLYLLSMKNAEQVSQELHIHKNTLFYRISKAKALLNVDLDDGENILKLMFSYKVLKQLSLFTPSRV